MKSVSFSGLLTVLLLAPPSKVLGCHLKSADVFPTCMSLLPGMPRPAQRRKGNNDNIERSKVEGWI